MKRFLSLLFLSFLCTCVSAQNETTTPEITTQLPLGSGSLLVEFGDGTWEVSLSSGTRYKKFQYVTEGLYLRRPVHFTGYTIVQGDNRYDLRMVHQLIDQLSLEGWELVATNYSNSQSANEWGTSITEKIFYQFSVPASTTPAFSEAAGESLNRIQVAIADRDQLRLRGALSQNEDGTFSLKMEEMSQGRWLTYYTLVGKGLLKGDSALRIRAVSASERKLRFRIEMANGNYDYYFIRGGDNGYYFSGVHFMSSEKCGVVQYTLNSLQTADGLLTGFYQPEPCASLEKPQQVYGRYPIYRTWLKDFIPGSQRIEMEEEQQTVFY
jgi:hypothetical protein